MFKVFWFLWILILLAVGAGLCVGLFPFRAWQSLIAENLAAYLLPVACFGLLTILFWWRAAWRVVSLYCLAQLLLGLWLHADTVRAFLLGSNSPALVSRATEVQGAELPISVAFVQPSNDDYARVSTQDLIQSIASETELVALVDVPKDLVESFRDTFAHRVFVDGKNGRGLGLLSKYPMVGDATVSLGDDVRPILLARIRLTDRIVLPVVVLQAPAPRSSESADESLVISRRLSTMLRHEFEHAIVIGALNATPFSRLYRNFVREAELRDVQWGRGLGDSGMARTWDMTTWWRRFSLDHVLFKGALRSLGVQVFSVPHSSRRGLLVVFSVRPDLFAK